MPTPGSIVGKKSSWPMPRMKTTAALLAPELPAVVLKVRLGTDCATAEIFVAPFCSSAAPVLAVTATGVFCSDSERRRAVTTLRTEGRRVGQEGVRSGRTGGGR